MDSTRQQRMGMTLVELIVVITIILMVAALAAAFMPRFQDRQNISRGVDLMSQWLLTAKQRARRDGLVTGLRFITDPNDPSANALQLPMAVYVQQPEPITGGNPPGSTPPSGVVVNPVSGVCLSVENQTGPWRATFANVDFFNGSGPGSDPTLWIVQQGDFLDLRSSGVHSITGPTVNSSPPAPFPPPAPGTSNALLLGTGTPFGLTATPPCQPTYNYRILRMPRELTGEPILQLPGNIVVDMNSGFSFNVPLRTLPTTPTPTSVYEILFSPDGSVVGPGVSGGKIILWVRDPTNADVNLGGLVCVQARTGFISSYDIFPGNPYQFADEGRDSGL
jgi:type II secretory pathway pseudopilin PulG